MTQTLRDLLPTLAKLAGARDERRSLAELARDNRTFASTFQRAFTRILGESPKQYTRRLQLESAALSLITTGASILNVALDSGFESHEGFSRVFSNHFGVAPKEFRRRYAHLGDQPHVELLEQIGPCIGLFRASLSTSPRKDNPMNYDITRQKIDDAKFLFMRGRCSHTEVADTLAKLLPAVFQYAVKNGVEMLSPPMTVYQEWGPGMVTLHAGIQVKNAEPSGEIEVATLPGGDAIVTVHTGAYDGLGDAHAALEQFIEAEGLKSAGPAREIYLTDPGEEPDPTDWKTQLIWPVDASS